MDLLTAPWKAFTMTNNKGAENNKNKNKNYPSIDDGMDDFDDRNKNEDPIMTTLLQQDIRAMSLPPQKKSDDDSSLTSSSSPSLLRNIMRRFGGSLFASAMLHGVALAATGGSALMLSKFLTWLFDYSAGAHAAQRSAYTRRLFSDNNTKSTKTFITPNSTSSTNATTTTPAPLPESGDGILFAVLVGALLLVAVVCEGCAATIALRVMMRLQRALSAMVCEALHAAPTVVLDVPPNKFSSEDSSDKGRDKSTASSSSPALGGPREARRLLDTALPQLMDIGGKRLHLFWSTPLLAAGVTYLLVQWISWAGAAVLFLILFSYSYLMPAVLREARFADAVKILTASRVRKVSEALENMAVLRANGWLGALFTAVTAARQIEEGALAQRTKAQAMMMWASACSSSLVDVSFVAIVFYVPVAFFPDAPAGSSYFTAGNIYPASVLCGHLRVAAMYMPLSLLNLRTVLKIIADCEALLRACVSTSGMTPTNGSSTTTMCECMIRPSNEENDDTLDSSSSGHHPISKLNTCKKHNTHNNADNDNHPWWCFALTSSLPHAPTTTASNTTCSTTCRTTNAETNHTLYLPRHTIIAVTGPTGCGKSALLKLLAGEDVRHYFTLNNKNTNSSSGSGGGGTSSENLTKTASSPSALFDVSSHHHHHHDDHHQTDGGVRRNGRCVYVAQDGLVFDGTIAENICGGEGNRYPRHYHHRGFNRGNQINQNWKTNHNNDNKHSENHPREITANQTRCREPTSNEDHYHLRSSNISELENTTQFVDDNGNDDKNKQEEGDEEEEEEDEYHRVEVLMSLCGMDMHKFTPHSTVSSTTLSGGERLRISLARALFSSAETVLLDEPVSALDPDIAEDFIANVLAPLRAMRLKTFIIATNHPRITGLLTSTFSATATASSATTCCATASNSDSKIYTEAKDGTASGCTRCHSTTTTTHCQHHHLPCTPPALSSSHPSSSSSSSSLVFGDGGIADYCLDMRQRPFVLVKTSDEETPPPPPPVFFEGATQQKQEATTLKREGRMEAAPTPPSTPQSPVSMKNLLLLQQQQQQNSSCSGSPRRVSAFSPPLRFQEESSRNSKANETQGGGDGGHDVPHRMIFAAKVDCDNHSMVTSTTTTTITTNLSPMNGMCPQDSPLMMNRIPAALSPCITSSSFGFDFDHPFNPPPPASIESGEIGFYNDSPFLEPQSTPPLFADLVSPPKNKKNDVVYNDNDNSREFNVNTNHRNAITTGSVQHEHGRIHQRKEYNSDNREHTGTTKSTPKLEANNKILKKSTASAPFDEDIATKNDNDNNAQREGSAPSAACSPPTHTLSSSSSDLVTGVRFLLQSAPWHVVAALFLLSLWRVNGYASERGLADAVARSPYLGHFSSISQGQAFMIFLISSLTSYGLFVSMTAPIVGAIRNLQRHLFRHLSVSVQHASFPAHAKMMRSGRLPTAFGSSLAVVDTLLFPMALTLIFGVVCVYFSFTIIYALPFAAVGIAATMTICAALTILYLRVSDAIHAKQSRLKDTTGRLQRLVTERALDVRCHNLSDLLRERLIATEGATLRAALVAGCWARWTELMVDTTVAIFCGGFCLHAAFDTIQLLGGDLNDDGSSSRAGVSSPARPPIAEAVLADRLSRLATACYAAMALKIVMAPLAFESTALVQAMRLVGAAVNTSLALRADPDPYWNTVAPLTPSPFSFYSSSSSSFEAESVEMSDNRSMHHPPTHRNEEEAEIEGDDSVGDGINGGLLLVSNLWMRYDKAASSSRSSPNAVKNSSKEKEEEEEEEEREEDGIKQGKGYNTKRNQKEQQQHALPKTAYSAILSTSPCVLRGLTLPPIPLGSMALIRGPSGCGKSSLFMALLGLYPPLLELGKKLSPVKRSQQQNQEQQQQQHQTYDGNKIAADGDYRRKHNVSLSFRSPCDRRHRASSSSSLADRHWRQHLLWVPQEAFLVEGTVLENVLFPLLLAKSSFSSSLSPYSSSTEAIAVTAAKTTTSIAVAEEEAQVNAVKAHQQEPAPPRHREQQQQPQLGRNEDQEEGEGEAWCALCRRMLDALDLHSLNLDDHVAARGANLSGGERQRIGIARALATLILQQQQQQKDTSSKKQRHDKLEHEKHQNQNQKDTSNENCRHQQPHDWRSRMVLLMDEPTSFLEPAACRKVLNVIRRVACEEHGAAVLIISHQNDDALAVVDLCVTLDGGVVTHAHKLHA